MNSRTVRRGFTLVEILIVVVILGVLAAIVIPQFANANIMSKKASLSEMLGRIRGQIQLYTMQHGDQRPNIHDQDWDDLMDRSTYHGSVCGPYLSAVPRNSLNNYSGVAVVAADPSWGDPVVGVNIGFVYNPTNGFIWATNTAGDKVYNEGDPDDPNN